MTAAPGPLELLARYPDRTRPLVTHYAGPGRRVELSVASVANAVAKAAGMLRDGLGLPPGAGVSVDLPVHWQLPVWTLAAVAVGARVGRDLPGPIDVRIVGPEGVARIAQGQDPHADEVLASSCDDFGLPLPGSVPASVVDIASEVRGYPDRFAAEPDALRAAAVLTWGSWLPWSRALAESGPPPAAAPPGPPAPRLWVDEQSPAADLLRLVAVVPLARGASIVLGAGLPADVANEVRRVEGVTARSA